MKIMNKMYRRNKISNKIIYFKVIPIMINNNLEVYLKLKKKKRNVAILKKIIVEKVVFSTLIINLQ